MLFESVGDENSRGKRRLMFLVLFDLHDSRLVFIKTVTHGVKGHVTGNGPVGFKRVNVIGCSAF